MVGPTQHEQIPATGHVTVISILARNAAGRIEQDDLQRAGVAAEISQKLPFRVGERREIGCDRGDGPCRDVMGISGVQIALDRLQAAVGRNPVTDIGGVPFDPRP